MDMIAAMSIEMTRAEPAKPAAMPVTTNMPAPIIAPTLMAVASNNPKVCLNLDWELLSLLISDTLKECVQELNYKWILGRFEIKILLE
jgi:hypothetical protein